MRRRLILAALLVLAVVVTAAPPVAADHTDPNSPVTLPFPAGGRPIAEQPITRGDGIWQLYSNFPFNVASDVTFFRKGDRTFAAQGTLGQGPTGPGPLGGVHVGQRIVQLMQGDDFVDGEAIGFRADHGSAACLQPATGVTGLQHDSFATPPADPEILVDSTDATGRCHDTPGGGIELIDVSGLDDPAFEPREVHLLRFDSTTHTVTLDSQRPWIIYANNSAFANGNWVDVVDIRSCLTQSGGGTLPDTATLEQKRAGCQPVVHRIPFEDVWTQQTFDGEGPPEGAAASCHDTVVEDDVMYCSALNSEVLLDLSGMFTEDGGVDGTPLPCPVIDAAPSPEASTGARVTNCVLPLNGAANQKAAYEALGKPSAEGWELIGFYNHPGRSDGSGGTTGNTNVEVPATEGVAVSHETRPIPAASTGDRRFIMVSDERGGGVVPGGANCTDDNFDIYGHGGLHVFDVTDPANITYATMVDGDGNEAKAVWRGDVVVPQPTFCVVHRFRFLEGEQRAVMGYYSQGAKILDYAIDEQGRFSFTEVASLQFADSNTWTADVFHSRDNLDGTRTYYIAMSDTLQAAGNATRGLDIVSWTGRPNPIRQPGDPAPPSVARVFGANRFATAVAASQAAYERADTVFLARADDYADALTGGPLAASEGAPILLTERNRLTPVTAAEIRRLGASRVVLLGGTAAISDAVAQALVAEDIEVDRIFGPNRFATAAAIAEEIGDDSGTVFLAEGINRDRTRGWPDAMSAAPYAAFSGQPILLTGRDLLPVETVQALAAAEASETIVVGGPAAVSDDVVAQVREAGHEPRRLAGRNRFETSRAVYEEGIEAGMDASVLYLATGRDWPDALTAGAIVGARGESLLLVDGGSLANSPATAAAITANRDAISHVNLLGGTAAISAQVAEQVGALLVAEDDDEGALAAPLRPGTPWLPMAPQGLLLLLAAGLLPAAAVLGRRRTAVAV
jgi:putative cell wall-binding protein